MSENTTHPSPKWQPTSVKKGIKAGMIARFGDLQDGDHFRRANGTLYAKVRLVATPVGLPRNNAVNLEYQASTFASDELVITVTSYPPREDYAAGETKRFDDLENGEVFQAHDKTFRKRTDWRKGSTWFEVIQSAGAAGNAIDESEMYPTIADDEQVELVKEAESDPSQYDWIFGIE